jgi:hyperosmotically inducible periplasmic protein
MRSLKNKSTSVRRNDGENLFNRRGQKSKLKTGEENMNRKYWLSFFFVVVIIFITACRQDNRDKKIKADLATKAESEKDFAGVTFTVEQGVVTLNGVCATDQAKSKVASTAEKVYGVKDVKSNITISPVTIGTDQLLKKAVDSVLKEYAAVEAITKDSIVYLQGKIESQKLKKLTDAINTLKPKMLENRLTIR